MRYVDNAEPVITLTSGPVNAYPDVLRGLGRTVLYDYDPAFQIFYEKVVEKAEVKVEPKAPLPRASIFGAARPREEVLKEQGRDWKKEELVRDSKLGRCV